MFESIYCFSFFFFYLDAEFGPFLISVFNFVTFFFSFYLQTGTVGFITGVRNLGRMISRLELFCYYYYFFSTDQTSKQAKRWSSSHHRALLFFLIFIFYVFVLFSCFESINIIHRTSFHSYALSLLFFSSIQASIFCLSSLFFISIKTTTYVSHSLTFSLFCSIISFSSLIRTFYVSPPPFYQLFFCPAFGLSDVNSFSCLSVWCGCMCVNTKRF